MNTNSLSSLPVLVKKNTVGKKIAKFLKQQQKLENTFTRESRNFQPGKVQIEGSKRCKPRVVNFFGDISTQIFCVDVSSDDQFVAAGCENGDVRVYDIYEGKILLMANSSRLQSYPNTGIRWRPKSNNQIATCNSDGTIKWYDREKQIATALHESDTGFLCLDYNSQGNICAFGNQKYQISIFDSQTKKQTIKYDAGSAEFWQPNHMNRIFCIKGIKKQPNLFYTGGWDSTVRVWDVRVPLQSVRKFYGPSISSETLDLRDDTLLVGNYANKQIVQIWDFKSGKLIQNLDLKQKQIGGSYCLCAGYAHKSKYNLFAAGLTSLNKIKIFQDRQVIANIRFQAQPLALCFYQFNGKDFMVASGVQGTIYVLKVKIYQN